MNIDRITGAAQESARRASRALATACALAALGAVALGFLTAAVYLALAGWIGAPWACVVLAALYALAAVIVWLAGRAGGGPPRRPRPDSPPGRRGPEPDAVSELIATFLAGVRAGREGFGRDRR